MSGGLSEELLSSRGLWERRLVGAVTQRWSVSPFALALRIYNSLGSLITSATLWRARNSAQVALVGAVQGARWLTARAQELRGENPLEGAASLGLDDDVLRESQIVIDGFVRDAAIDLRLIEDGNFDRLRREAFRVEDRFLGNAGRRIDLVIEDLASRHSGFATRLIYETLLCILLAYVLCWPAYSFFFAHPWQGRPLISSDFYIHAAVYLGLWSGLLVMIFTRRLRSGLVERINQLAVKLAESRLSSGLFPELERSLEDIRLQRERLEALLIATAALRRETGGNITLGAQREPVSSVAASESVAAI
jgi:hypothetical protein